ncbi:hypothetical protein DIPPA_16336 [Diplonema papillatum]|nr:hypothetical protein DIPPA_16336 [Diplonema papillatum]
MQVSRLNTCSELLRMIERKGDAEGCMQPLERFDREVVGKLAKDLEVVMERHLGDDASTDAAARMRDDLLTEWVAGLQLSSYKYRRGQEQGTREGRVAELQEAVWGSEEVVIQVKAWSKQGSRDIARLQAPIPRDLLFCAKDSESYRLSFLRGTNLAAGYVTLQIRAAMHKTWVAVLDARDLFCYIAYCNTRGYTANLSADVAPAPANHDPAALPDLQQGKGLQRACHISLRRATLQNKRPLPFPSSANADEAAQRSKPRLDGGWGREADRRGLDTGTEALPAHLDGAQPAEALRTKTGQAGLGTVFGERTPAQLDGGQPAEALKAKTHQAGLGFRQAASGEAEHRSKPRLDGGWGPEADRSGLGTGFGGTEASPAHLDGAQSAEALQAKTHQAGLGFRCSASGEAEHRSRPRLDGEARRGNGCFGAWFGGDKALRLARSGGGASRAETDRGGLGTGFGRTETSLAHLDGGQPAEAVRTKTDQEGLGTVFGGTEASLAHLDGEQPAVALRTKTDQAGLGTVFRGTETLLAHLDGGQPAGAWRTKTDQAGLGTVFGGTKTPRTPAHLDGGPQAAEDGGDGGGGGGGGGGGEFAGMLDDPEAVDALGLAGDDDEADLLGDGGEELNSDDDDNEVRQVTLRVPAVTEVAGFITVTRPDGNGLFTTEIPKGLQVGDAFSATLAVPRARVCRTFGPTTSPFCSTEGSRNWAVLHACYTMVPYKGNRRLPYGAPVRVKQLPGSKRGQKAAAPQYREPAWELTSICLRVRQDNPRRRYPDILEIELPLGRFVFPKPVTGRKA